MQWDVEFTNIQNNGHKIKMFRALALNLQNNACITIIIIYQLKALRTTVMRTLIRR